MKHRSMVPARRVAASVVALFLAMSTLSAVASPAPASASASLVEAVPADGDTVTSVPPWITLSFSGDVKQAGSSIEVDYRGRNIAAGELTVKGRDVTVALPDQQTEGKYTVIWRVASADGDAVSGRYSFSVAFDPGPGITDPAKIPTDAPPASDPPSSPPPPSPSDPPTSSAPATPTESPSPSESPASVPAPPTDSASPAATTAETAPQPIAPASGGGLAPGWIALLGLVGAGLVATVIVLAVRRYREHAGDGPEGGAES